MDRRIVKVKGIAFISWLVFALSIFLPHGHMSMPLAVLTGIAFVSFAGSIVYLARFTHCPKCGYSLGHAMFQSQGWMGKESSVNFCPGCGQDLNQPHS